MHQHVIIWRIWVKGILKKDYLKYVELSSTLKPSDQGSENKNVGSSQQMPASRFNSKGS